MASRKVHGTFLVISVVFRGPTWLPNIPSIFPSNFQNFRAISQETFLAILVAFWGLILVPKVPSVFPSNFENFQAFSQ